MTIDLQNFVLYIFLLFTVYRQEPQRKEVAMISHVNGLEEG